MVLITGGSGYLGGRIATHLEQLGYQVRVGKSVKSNSNGFPIDFTDDHSINSACDGISSIIHLAAMNAQSCNDNPEKALLINSLGTLKLLKAAKKNKISKFLYFSTAHIYGSPLIGEINEELLPRPLHPYSITHRVAEDYVMEEACQHGLSASVFRLTNAIGSPITPQANCWMLVANDLCRQAVINNSIKVHSNKFLQRDFIPISSICSVVSSSLNSNVLDGEIVNLSSGIAITLQSLAVLIADRSEVVLGFRPHINFLNNSIETDTERLIISNSKLSDLGFKIDNNLSDEIDQLLLNCNKWFSN
jgi:UDP-glucose 4-epimerase